MKNIFLINPSAGKGGGGRIAEKIKEAAKGLSIKVEIYETTGVGDGEKYVRFLCQSRTDHQVLRFFACGGDGALSEVINGSFGYENVEVGCIPLGTGNDYVRNYGHPEDFLSIKGQLTGCSMDSDLIRYDQVIDGNLVERYCVNMFNIGFDCNVVDLTRKVKQWPLIGGSLAYLVSVGIILIKKKGAELTVYSEDEMVFDGKMLLIAIGNGCYCGGGIKGVPKAILDDGLMDVSLIRNMSRRCFIKLFPKYTKGVHLEEKNVDNLLIYNQCKKLTIIPKNGIMRLCTDGEITMAEKVEFSIIPKGIKFIVPSKG
ncbi:MAG: diacylglycerol kinase family protein [Anaerovoracaceae bacterium]